LFTVFTEFGLSAIDQPLPSHCSIRSVPTAKQLVGLLHDTPMSELLYGEGRFGLATIDQVAPSHCSISVFCAESPGMRCQPAAKQLVVLAHDTLRSTLGNEPTGSGLVRADQLVPFHSSMKVLPSTPPPTATQKVGLAHETAEGQASGGPGGLGLGRTVTADAALAADPNDMLHTNIAATAATLRQCVLRRMLAPLATPQQVHQNTAPPARTNDRPI
jgi:hypothetical protein